MLKHSSATFEPIEFESSHFALEGLCTKEEEGAGRLEPQHFALYAANLPTDAKEYADQLWLKKENLLFNLSPEIAAVIKAWNLC